MFRESLSVAFKFYLKDTHYRYKNFQESREMARMLRVIRIKVPILAPSDKLGTTHIPILASCDKVGTTHISILASCDKVGTTHIYPCN